MSKLNNINNRPLCILFLFIKTRLQLIAELLYLAEKVQPKFLFCHQKNLNWAKQLEIDLGYHVQAISMDQNNGSTDSKQQNLHATFKELLNYDHTKSKSLHYVPVACKNIQQDVALITMSSGTTGRPKAVPTTHKKCITDLFSTTKRNQNRGLKMASPTSLDYVSSRLVVLGAIESGFTAIIMNGVDPKTLAEAIEKYKINILYLGADSFYAFITHKDLDNYDLSSLKLVFPMGAKIVYMDAMKEFLSKHPNITQLRQGFGASEICAGAINDMTPEEYVRDCDNCGRLLPGVKAKIVHPETGELLGPNQEGELHIKNANNFLGYYDARRLKINTHDNANDELSPFVSDATIFDQDGFYITGDLAKFNNKEELYIVGRQKELMSCRNSAKVLPQELERLIEQHPAVSKVSVLGIQSKTRLTIQCPRAFIVPKRNYYTDEEIKPTQRLPPEQRGDLDEEEVEDNLKFTGKHEFCKMSTNRRHKLSIDIMEFVDDRIGWEKRLTGGIVLIDEVPTLRSTGKVNKTYLRSLDLDQIEIYGDRSMM